MRWTVVIPAKALPAAKSRLLPASSGPAEHGQLVEAIRADTADAARATPAVARVLVVSDRPAGDALVQTTPGLDGAVLDAAAHAAAHWPGDGLAVLLGDLPAMRSEHLATVLAAAAGHPRAFVADADGTGTTLLTAAPGVTPAPAFGAGSAARHAAGAVALDAPAGLRTDVDTARDLRAAAALGVGPRTAEVLATRAAGPRAAVHLDVG